jgi:hypothetical protein
MIIQNLGQSLEAPFAPTSPNNALTAEIASSLSSGELVTHASGSMLATPSKSFGLYEFYFGCGLFDATPEAGTSTGCTITVTGYYLDGSLAPVQTYGFAPDKATKATMNRAELSPAYYAGLLNVTFALENSADTNELTVFAVDNILHCNS